MQGQVRDVHVGSSSRPLAALAGAGLLGCTRLVGGAVAPEASPPLGAAVCTAWPPNWLRIAAIAFIVGESSWRETKRA